MSRQADALRLADELESYVGRPVCTEAAAELRRLHASNAELLAALYDMVEDGDETDKQKAIAAIANATKDQP